MFYYKWISLIIYVSFCLFKNSTRNPGLDQKWSTLDQNWSNPKIFFWDFWSYFSKLFKVLKKYFRNINSFMHFQVGPLLVRVSSTEKYFIFRPHYLAAWKEWKSSASKSSIMKSYWYYSIILWTMNYKLSNAFFFCVSDWPSLNLQASDWPKIFFCALIGWSL